MCGIFNNSAPIELPTPHNLEEALLYSAFWDYPPNQNYFDEVYHYTTAAGLNSILQKDGIHLWFTRWDCVNDMSEGQDVLDIFHQTGERLLAENKIDTDFWGKLRNIHAANCLPFDFWLRNHNGNQREGSMVCLCSPYICCFSRDKDSLPMWNYYAKDGSVQGYNIKLFPKFLQDEYENYKFTNENSQHTNLGLEIRYHAVIYEEQQKSEIIEKAIMRLYPFRNEREDAMDEILERMKSCLRDWGLIFKKQCFKYENEVRMILMRPDEYPTNAVDYKRIEINYRTKMGYLIPYVEMVFNNKQSVQGITIGQLGSEENQNFAKLTLQSFLKTRAYTNKIDCSNIEFRPL